MKQREIFYPRQLRLGQAKVRSLELCESFMGARVPAVPMVLISRKLDLEVEPTLRSMRCVGPRRIFTAVLNVPPAPFFFSLK